MTTVNWTKTAGGDWSSGSDWSTGSPPDASSDASISAIGTYQVAITTPAAAASLVLNDAGATVLDSGSLTLGGPLTLTAGTFNLDTTGSLGWTSGTGALAIGGGATFHATGAHTLDNVQISMGTPNPALGQANLTFDNLTLGANATIGFNGGPASTSSAFQSITGTSLTNNGVIEALQNYASGIIYVGTLTNNGTLLNSSASGYTVEATDITNTGTITASGPGGIGISAFGTFTNSGVINDSAGIAVASPGFVNNGTINLTGSGGYFAVVAPLSSTPVVPAWTMTGTGAIDMKGVGNTLEFIETQTFGQGTINLTGSNEQMMITSSATNAPSGSVSAYLTIGSAAVINQTSGTAIFTYSNPGGGLADALVNDGTINLSASGGLATIATTAFTNNGTVSVSNADHLVVQTAMDGSGAIDIASGGVAEFAAAAASSDQVAFLDGQSDLLRLDAAASFASTISGFGVGDTINLKALVATTASWSAGILTLGLSGGGSLKLNLAGSYGGATFKLTSDGAGGTNITLGQSAVDSWAQPVNGAWSDATKWSTGKVPTASDDALIGGTTGYVVTVGAAAAAHSLTLNDASTSVQLTGPLTLGTALTVTAGAIDIGGGPGGGTITAASLTNNGTITGDAAIDGGVPPGAVSQTNIHFINVSGAFINNGVLSSDAAGGVISEVLVTAGSVTNTGTVRSSAASAGYVELNSTVSVTNSGTFTTTATGGIGVSAPSFVNNGQINIAGGNDDLEITSAYPGGAFSTPTTITGTGTITLSGAGSRIRFIGSQTFSQGTIDLTGAGATLTDASVGVPGGLPTSLLTFGAQSVINATGSSADITSWYNASNRVTNNGAINASTAGGTLTIDPALFTNNGTIAVTGGDKLLLKTATDGTGTISLAGGSTAEIVKGLASVGHVSFADAAADLLRLDAPSGFAATVSGFAKGDVIDLRTLAASSAAWSGGVLTVQLSGGGTYSLNLAGAYGGTSFQVASDGAGGSLITIGSSSPPPTGLSGAISLANATEGSATMTQVASFTDSTLSDTASAFSALITWGDGTTSTGTVAGSGGAFTVSASGGHIYAAEGSYAAKVDVTRTADSAKLSLSGTVAVGEGDGLAVQTAPSFSATEQQAFSATIATFTDTYTGNVASDFTATIDWGDGSTSAGVVTFNNGLISVAGAHSYGAAGTDPVKVTLQEVDSTASIVASGTAVVAPSPDDTYLLTPHADALTDTDGDDTYVAASNTLTKGDVITGGGGLNRMILSGGGTFDLRAPTTLFGIPTVNAQEGQPAYSNGALNFPNTRQVIYLRDGLDLTLNVGANPSPNAQNPNLSGIVIFGANNHDVINLSGGADQVFVGSANETVNGGGGRNQIVVNAATVAARLDGGGGASTLCLTGGGAVSLGGNITDFATVNLGAPPAGGTQPAWNFTANGIHGMKISDTSGGADVITVGDASQIVATGGGTYLVKLSALTGGALVWASSGSDRVEITGGGTVTLNPGDHGVSTVTLDQTTNVTVGPGVGQVIGSAGADRITAGGKNEILTGGGGLDTLVGYAGGYDTFKDTAAHLNGDGIRNFASAGDRIDVTDLAYTGSTPTFVEDASNAFGVLTLTDGAHTAKVTLFGQFAASGFHAAGDGGAGEIVTYTPPAQHALALPGS